MLTVLLVASLCAGSPRSAQADEARLRVGIVSDTHITDEASALPFQRALEYFRDRGVDAVLHGGDISDWGLVSGWRYAAEAWERVFPGDKAPGGREVVKLFTTGNHDFEGCKYWDQSEEMHANGFSESELLVRNGIDRQWKKIFGLEFKPVTCQRVKGYDFLSCHWNDRKAIVDWMRKNGQRVAGPRPFFFFQHGHPQGTIPGDNWGDGGAAKEAFADYPNAVVFGSHTHLSLTDGHEIWQGEFTAVGTASLSWSELPFGYENARPFDPNSDYIEQMPLLPCRFKQENKQGLLMSVYDDRIVFERVDFGGECELDAPWVVPLPACRGRSPWSHENQVKSMPVPQFLPGSVVKTRTVVGRDRKGNMSVQMVLDFPAAADGKTRAYDYAIAARTDDGRETVLAKVLSPTYNYGVSRECAGVQAVVSVRKLPVDVPYRLIVRPRNSFGVCGNPIVSEPRKGLPL